MNKYKDYIRLCLESLDDTDNADDSMILLVARRGC